MAILIDPNPNPKDRVLRSPRCGFRLVTVSPLKVTDLSCHILDTRIDNGVVDARSSNRKVIAENQRRVFDGGQISYPVDASGSCTGSLRPTVSIPLQARSRSDSALTNCWISHGISGRWLGAIDIEVCLCIRVTTRITSQLCVPNDLLSGTVSDKVKKYVVPARCCRGTAAATPTPAISCKKCFIMKYIFQSQS